MENGQKKKPEELVFQWAGAQGAAANLGEEAQMLKDRTEADLLEYATLELFNKDKSQFTPAENEVVSRLVKDLDDELALANKYKTLTNEERRLLESE